MAVTKTKLTQEELLAEAKAMVETYMRDRNTADRCERICSQFDDILEMPLDIVKDGKAAKERIQFNIVGKVDEMAHLMDELINVIEKQDTQLKSDRN